MSPFSNRGPSPASRGVSSSCRRHPLSFEPMRLFTQDTVACYASNTESCLTIRSVGSVFSDRVIRSTSVPMRAHACLSPRTTYIAVGGWAHKHKDALRVACARSAGEAERSRVHSTHLHSYTFRLSSRSTCPPFSIGVHPQRPRPMRLAQMSRH